MAANRKALTGSERRQAVRLYKQGLSYREIGRRLCRSDRAVADAVIAADLLEEDRMGDDDQLVQVHPFDPPAALGGYSSTWAGDMGRLPLRLPRVCRMLSTREYEHAD